LLIALALLGFGARLLGWLNAQALEGFMFLIPLAVFGTVVGRVLGQWLVRRQAFGVTAASSVLSTVLVNMAKVALGVQMPSAAVLVATNTVGGLVGTALTYAGWRRVRGPAAPAPPNDAPASAWAMARAHRDFPLLRTPQDLINTLSQSLPVLLLAAYFGSAAAGHYGIALVVLGVPAALVGNAVMAVFYPRITQAVHDGEDARALILRATRGMVGTGAAPFLLLLLAGPTLFGWVFGPAWRPAGVYAQWLAPWLFMQFINQPAVSAIPALRLQRGLLIYELFSTGTKVLALWLGFVVFGSDVVAVALFSVFGALAYAWLIAWVLRNSRPRAGAPG
jgi:O-antigen/teichoic acid export membrane protein